MRAHKLIPGLLICVLIASTGGAYYSFFAIWLLASAALFLAVRHRSFIRMITPAILIVVIFGVFLANMAPNLIYFLKHGRTDVAERKAAEAEVYGLKIAQLLLPASDHRVKSLADFKARYDLSPLNTENVDSTLGFIGGFGFLFLIGWLLYRKGRDELDQPPALFNHLSMLNASAVLIGTVGGFGSVFAHLISPQIRAYNRISVFIAFFSFFAVALLLDLLSRRFFQSGSRRKIFYVLILTLTALGALDQTGRRSRPDYNDVKAEYLSDREFIRRIESAMPRDAMIFQLPVQNFPEGESKDHLKAYLHSDSLRWSFGAIDLREGANWQATVAAAPVNEMIDTIALAGFSGVYIDRAQYQDKGAKIEAAISGLLQSAPWVSGNQRLSFFSLIEYRKKLGGDPQKALRPLSLKWRQGFYEMEGSPEDNWRWCSTAGELLIENLSLGEREAIIEMGASSINPGRLRIESRDFSEVIQINSVNTPFSKRLVIPPGAYSIRFISDAPAASPPPETRALSFRVNNFKLKEVER
jgi:phosphoglycerol transferase